MGVLKITILETDRVHEVLIQLMKTPGILRTKLYDELEKKGAGKATIIKRVNELIGAEIIRIEKSKTHKAGQYLYLTEQGLKIAKLANKMQKIIDKEEDEEDGEDFDIATFEVEKDKIIN